MVFCSCQAWAYYSVMDNGEILAPGKFKTTAETQFLTNEGGGLNVSGRFDMGVDDQTGVRGEVGFGKTDFFMGALFKWMPFPDVGQQPNIGFNAGVIYARDRGDNELSLRFEPLVSKFFETGFGGLTPYASLPFGIRSVADDTETPLQLVFGTQIKTNQLEHIQFLVEAGIDLNDSFSYISVGGVLYFDEENGLQFN